MDDDSRPPLADDQDFLASIEALDSGLAPEAPETAPRPRLAPASPPARRSAPARPSLDTLFPRGQAPAREPSGPLTYEPFYGLLEKPFSLASDPRFLFHSHSHDRAAQTLLSAIRRREGVVVLTGEIGTGKTTLCRAVLDQLDRRTLTSFVKDPSMSAEDVLKTALVDFGVLSHDDLAQGHLIRATRRDLSAALRDFLTSLEPLHAFAVIIIDEAQNLSPDVLEQVRMLSDMEAEDRLIQVVLVGQPALLKTLRQPEMRPLDQRISVRTRLEPLGAGELGAYIGHRLAVAGGDGRQVFDGGAIARVFELSLGVPRVVNLLCDRALEDGRDRSMPIVAEPLIELAARELNLAAPDAPRPRTAAVWGMTAILLMIMALVGATGAAIVFHDRIAAVINRWQAPVPPK